MKSITVFCGSRTGIDKRIERQAYQLGKNIALRNINLVYGGAKVGLMGMLAKGALDSRGTVIGVLPNFLREKEIANDSLTQLIIVETMHERKLKMNELSEGFITIPGGFGTLEEFCEIISWAKLGLHTKPIGLLNINGFYDGLISTFGKMVSDGYLSKMHFEMILTSDKIETLLNRMQDYTGPTSPRPLARIKELV